MPSRVILWNVEGVVLILLKQSGIIYTNQTGGHACCKAETEGVLVPFNNDYPHDQPDLSIEQRLNRLLTNVECLTPQLADDIDDIFSSSPDTRYAKVDRTRLRDSMEAWVYVVVYDAGDHLISGFGRCKGIITWRNSD